MPDVDEHDERPLWEDHGKSEHGTPAFDVQIDGRMVTVNPDDHPAEYVWFPVDVENATTQWYVCRRHPDEPRFCAVSTCSGCHAPPKQADVGLLSLPEWWEPSDTVVAWQRRRSPTDHTMGRHVPGKGLRCREHDALFALDECCRSCIAEDEEAEL